MVITTVILKELKTKCENSPNFDAKRFQSGYHMIRNLLKIWHDCNDVDPPRVYFLGRRIHHGSLGVILVPLGMLCQLNKDSFLLGAAYALIKDDIIDALEWFDFECGGDPQKIISLE